MKKEIVCRRCGGTGKVELPVHLRSTLALFETNRKTPVQMTPREGHEKLFANNPDATRAATNGRFEDLRQAGLLSRRQSGKGREYLYFLAR